MNTLYKIETDNIFSFRYQIHCRFIITYELKKMLAATKTIKRISFVNKYSICFDKAEMFSFDEMQEKVDKTIAAYLAIYHDYDKTEDSERQIAKNNNWWHRFLASVAKLMNKLNINIKQLFLLKEQ